MSSSEISFRTRQKIRQNIEKLRWQSANGSVGELFVPQQIKNWKIQPQTFPSDSIHFFGLGSNRQKLIVLYDRNFPEKIQQTQSRAERLLNHHFHFLGLDIKLPQKIPWNRNPQRDVSYPQIYNKNLNVYDTERYGDVKYVWELNRHQFLIELAKAHFLTGEEKYAGKIWDWIESWIEYNPYKIGVNWTSALEAAVRVFSWTWTFFFTKESPIWTAERKELLIKNLLLHGIYIEENLSYYYSPYNHLIGELAALSFLGMLFPELPKSKDWREKYWNEMEVQIDKQFRPDGFTVEEAAYYHHFTFGFYIMLAQLRKQNGLPVSETVWKRIEQALEIVMYMTRPDGHLPMIGDIDNARSIYFYHPEDQWNLRAFLVLGAVMFGRGDMKHVAGDLSEEALWLFGEEGVEKYQQLPEQKPQFSSKAFSDSGYFIMRDGWEADSNYCCFDCGEIAHGVHKDNTPSAAHGHADILSFELSIEGKPLIVDPGLHTYFGPLDWHRYFRLTQAHNLITVNDCGQAQHEGRISWSRVSSPQLITWFSNPHLDFVGGTIDRFANLEEGIFHRRYILNRKPYYYLVMDEIAGAEELGQKFKVSSFLHFSKADLQLKDSAVYRDGEKVGAFSTTLKTKIKMEVGGDQPHQGWVAPGYGYRNPAPVIKLETTNQLPVKLGMLFPTKHLKESLVSFSSSEYQDGITRYEIENKDWREIIFLNPSKKTFEIKEFQSMQTDALCLVVKSNHQLVHELVAINLTNLAVNGKNVMSNKLSGVKIDFDNQGQYSVEQWK